MIPNFLPLDKSFKMSFKIILYDILQKGSDFSPLCCAPDQNKLSVDLAGKFGVNNGCTARNPYKKQPKPTYAMLQGLVSVAIASFWRMRMVKVFNYSAFQTRARGNFHSIRSCDTASRSVETVNLTSLLMLC